MNAPASALHSAFVGAFIPYLKGILDERRLPPLPDEALSSARAWLEEELAHLLALPFSRQHRSPLEVVQEAMAGPTAELDRVGAVAPLRDPVAVAALPGDRYGLAPASSNVLGEEAFAAHMAWGIAKAAALAPLVSGQGRQVIVVSNDLIDRSRIEDAVRGAELQMQSWPVAESTDVPRPVLAFVDVTHPDADEAIAVLAAAGTSVVAYG
ncbi:MAG: hypothetical protein HKN80_08045, partial [Acidimicrobiia bacterium]|nr:hypothetical protein [Acidimicrobiia bacterium]